MLPFRTYPFRIDYTNPKDGDTAQYLSNGIGIRLTGPADPNSVSSAIKINPYFPGELSGFPGFISIYSRDHDLTPNTIYHVTISTALRSKDGKNLQSPYTFSFVTPPFKVLNTDPSNGEQYVQRLQYISVSFDGRIDTASARLAFSMEPRVPGHFLTRYYGTTNFTYSPDSIYAAATTYRVIVSTALRSIDGVHIARPDTISFTTMP